MGQEKVSRGEALPIGNVLQETASSNVGCVHDTLVGYTVLGTDMLEDSLVIRETTLF